ncbi:MAG: DNA repair protein RecO [Clostridiales bacterium]|nr:DNA repair protein RecO [Clostridiales bacterium]
MSTFKDKGVVLKEYAAGEYDKNLLLLLKERGRVNVFAKGARKPNSKFFAGTQLFCYCEFVIFEGSGFLSLTQTELIQNFYRLTEDYDKFLSAGSFLTLAGEMLLPAMPSADALYLLIKAFQALSKELMDKRLVRSVFEIKFMQTEGYSPQLDECIHCGESVSGALFFEPQGVVCKNCAHRALKAVAVSDQTVAIMRYILNHDTKDLFKLTVANPAVIENLQAVSQFFVKNNR